MTRTYKAINGWNRETMKLAICVGNNGTRAANEIGRCYYLTPDGNRCAAGCFVPYGHAAERNDGRIGKVLEIYPDLRGAMPLNKIGMAALQHEHDIHAYRRDSRDMRDVLCEWIDDNVIDPGEVV